MALTNYNYKSVTDYYKDNFSLKWLPIPMIRKFELIAMICFLTNYFNKKKAEGEKYSCYQIICKIGKNCPDSVKQDYFKALGAICDDFMFECVEFPTFGIDPKVMPGEVLKLLNEWFPF